MRNQRRSGIGMTVLDATGIADQARIPQTNQPFQNHSPHSNEYTAENW